MKRWQIIVLILVFVAAVVSGCAQPPTEPTTVPTEVQTLPSGGEPISLEGLDCLVEIHVFAGSGGGGDFEPYKYYVIRDGGSCEKLGIFVAPGAMGLFLGGLMAGKLPWLLLPAAVLMLMLLCLVRSGGEISTAPSQKSPVFLAVCCFAVVVLRSFVGFRVVFPWRTGAMALAATAAVVLGKMAGGVLAVRFGMKKTTLLSLSMAALGYGLGSIPVFGLLALLCFNMTMPLTLYALWRRFPEYPGTVFGSLTLALFVGFLPSCFGVNLPISGVLGSILSLCLLWKAVDDD